MSKEISNITCEMSALNNPKLISMFCGELAKNLNVYSLLITFSCNKTDYRYELILRCESKVINDAMMKSIKLSIVNYINEQQNTLSLSQIMESNQTEKSTQFEDSVMWYAIKDLLKNLNINLYYCILARSTDNTYLGYLIEHQESKLFSPVIGRSLPADEILMTHYTSVFMQTLQKIGKDISRSTHDFKKNCTIS